MQQALPYLKRRMTHIFRPDGRALIVALDHARSGPTPGLERPGETIAQVVAGGADAIMTTFGVARSFWHQLGGRGLIFATDGLRPVTEQVVLDAVRLGADAVELKVFPGNPEETRLPELNRLALTCSEWGMPLLAEPIPVSFAEAAAHTPENIARAARVAAEAGADFVKVHYTGSIESMRRVIDACYVPVVILGGPRMESERDVLQMVADALEAGARGIAFGRNIFAHPRPDRMTAALAVVIHSEASVDQAMRELAPLAAV
jgi:class I fructose-bisphosphate aldolase/fructose-bisphosphate aldolase/2-amino-3,7-dideoxy-D-threo-hept-6-ulosonate synthase